MTILDMELEPLSMHELSTLKYEFTQDFDKMTTKDALSLLRLVVPTIKNDNYDDEKVILLLRRLNMILDFKNNPELLI